MEVRVQTGIRSMDEFGYEIYRVAKFDWIMGPKGYKDGIQPPNADSNG